LPVAGLAGVRAGASSLGRRRCPRPMFNRQKKREVMDKSGGVAYGIWLILTTMSSDKFNENQS